jgi:hypothetical protein
MRDSIILRAIFRTSNAFFFDDPQQSGKATPAGDLVCFGVGSALRL